MRPYKVSISIVFGCTQPKIIGIDATAFPLDQRIAALLLLSDAGTRTEIR